MKRRNQISLLNESQPTYCTVQKAKKSATNKKTPINGELFTVRCQIGSSAGSGSCVILYLVFPIIQPKAQAQPIMKFWIEYSVIPYDDYNLCFFSFPGSGKQTKLKPLHSVPVWSSMRNNFVRDMPDATKVWPCPFFQRSPSSKQGACPFTTYSTSRYVMTTMMFSLVALPLSCQTFEPLRPLSFFSILEGNKNGAA